MFGVRPASTTLCAVTSWLSIGVALVTDVPAPYSTCDVAGASVVHVIVAESGPMLDAVRPEIVGAELDG